MSDDPNLSPAAQGYRMPAEWEPQEAVWFSWPSPHRENWPGTVDRVEAVFAEIISAASHYETVRINAPGEIHESIGNALNVACADFDQIELFDHPNNDVWCRDHGAIFLKNDKTGGIAATNWGFNGWGDKFTPYDLDNRIPACMAESLGLPLVDAGMILEGGSIEVNSLGQLLTTEAVLLNPNRNPDLSQGEIESRLRDYLGVKDIFWLGQGIEGDDTDGHIDDLARFVNDATILISKEPDPSSPNRRVLDENFERIQDFRLPDGSRPEIIRLDLPKACHAPDWRLPVLPASYVNFLILNGAVLMPTFGQGAQDREAAGVLGEVFPDRKVIPINVLDIVKEGGAIHCISQQQPSAG